MILILFCVISSSMMPDNKELWINRQETQSSACISSKQKIMEMNFRVYKMPQKEFN